MKQLDLIDPGDLPEFDSPELKIKTPSRPIWTEHKAKLIARYLRYFVFITHHGNYIDGFAGPQNQFHKDLWSARLVLENEPRWLKKFFLADIDPHKIELLQRLWACQPTRKKGDAKRTASIHEGDFNATVKTILTEENIRETEATFALLDQRAFECHWSTVEALADFKRVGRKIELFYFFAEGWMNRSIKATTKNFHTLDSWWGNDDWRKLPDVSSINRAQLVCDRIRDEFSYKYVLPYPIMGREHGRGRTMYYMIHATDHDEAPTLMNRAYRNVVKPVESPENLQMEFAELRKHYDKNN